MEKKLLSMPINSIELEGLLFLPENTKSLVIFVHGSGSSRHSPRNNFVAQELNKSGFGTLLFDLLTYEEDRDYNKRFDIKLLTERLVFVTEWILNQENCKNLNIGYFGASTGAAAALSAAVLQENKIKAVVSRGGRPDLTYFPFNKMACPTLLIVGGEDKIVLELNELAYKQIAGSKELAVIEGATHLFEEPGALQQVSNLAVDWFKKYLVLRT